MRGACTGANSATHRGHVTMCMKQAAKLKDVFGRVKEALDVASGISGLEFATSGNYGKVTELPY